jgi:hypothetical protein
MWGARQGGIARTTKHFDTEDAARQFASENTVPPTYNYVVTDPSKLDILGKYGVVGTAGGGMGVLAAQDQYGAQP